MAGSFDLLALRGLGFCGVHRRRHTDADNPSHHEGDPQPADGTKALPKHACGQDRGHYRLYRSSQ